MNPTSQSHYTCPRQTICVVARLSMVILSWVWRVPQLEGWSLRRISPLVARHDRQLYITHGSSLLMRPEPNRVLYGVVWKPSLVMNLLP